MVRSILDGENVLQCTLLPFLSFYCQVDELAGLYAYFTKQGWPFIKLGKKCSIT